MSGPAVAVGVPAGAASALQDLGVRVRQVLARQQLAEVAVELQAALVVVVGQVAAEKLERRQKMENE